VDTFQGKAKEFNVIHYTLFVAYFPHLIAGPVLHHQEMMPQFSKRHVCFFNWDNVAVGFSIFVLGLAKKVLIADTLAKFATPLFGFVGSGGQPMFFEAWIGALAYTLQLYFDFSAYSDMAIGLSLMFNVRLPMNFNSPYKAISIIDFWRRWHMTLSRFLRDYVYIPLGGSRKSTGHRYLNLIITMLLGGFWHGAGWTFLIWGALHGFYLLVNHAWRSFKNHYGLSNGGRLAKLGAGFLTFLAVIVGWVFFRADNFSSAITVLKSMTGFNGIAFPSSFESKIGQFVSGHEWLFFKDPLFSLKKPSLVLIVCLFVVWLMPNIGELFQAYQPTCEDLHKKHTTSETTTNPKNNIPFKLLLWRPTTIYALCLAFLFFYCFISLTQVSEFLYFQF
jgi:alginate O-acetyltransferase complex protein AlgI